MAFNINDPALNIKCPDCGQVGNKSYYSIQWSDGVKWRRVRCNYCGKVRIGKVYAEANPQFDAEFRADKATEAKPIQPAPKPEVIAEPKPQPVNVVAAVTGLESCSWLQVVKTEKPQAEPKPQPVPFPYKGITFTKCPTCGEAASTLYDPNDPYLEIGKGGGHFNRMGRKVNKGYYVFDWYCRKCKAKKTEKHTEVDHGVQS